MVVSLDRPFGFPVRKDNASLFGCLTFGLFVSSILWTGLNPVDVAVPMFGLIETMLKWSYRVMLIPALLLQSYTLRQFLPILAVAAIFGLVSITSADPTCLLVFAVLVACRNIDPMTLIKVFLSVNATFLVLVFLFHFSSITAPIYVQRGEDVYARTSLGLGHPNSLGSVFLSLGVAWIVFRYSDFKLMDLLPVIALLVMNDQICDSRTTSFVLLISMVSIVSMRASKRFFKRNIFPAIAVFSVLATTAILILVLVYDPHVSWMKSIDTLLSSRLYNCNLFIHKYKPLMLGRDVTNLPTAYIYEWNGEEISFLVDNSVVRSLIAYGIPATFLMVAGVAMGLFGPKRTVMHEALAFGLCMMVFAGAMESTLFSLDTNPYLIVIPSTVLMNRRSYQPKHMMRKETLLRKGLFQNGK